jgi:hypothetical protein
VHGINAVAPQLREQDFRVDQVFGTTQCDNVYFGFGISFGFHSALFFKRAKLLKITVPGGFALQAKNYLYSREKMALDRCISFAHRLSG